MNAVLDVNETTPFPPGTRLGGKYVVRRLIARGGSSEVYEAEHAVVGRVVALKVVHASPGTAEGMLERLRREARICGSLRHPHVCEVYDVGHLEDGVPYLVMELLNGPTLADRVEQGPLPIASAVEVGRAVAAALAAAHRAGVIHRDVKPHNVILHRRDDGQVVVKLVDFGIARPLVFTGMDRSVTVEGMLVGTPHYMAPEQLRAEGADERSDVYALGVMLYEALTGHVPFDEPTLASLSAAVLRDPIVPPSRYRPDCGSDLESIVLAAMARSPVERIQSAEELLASLVHVATWRGLPTGADAFGAAADVPPRGEDVPTLPGVDTNQHPVVRAADSLVPPRGESVPPEAERRRRWPLGALAAAAVVAVAVGSWAWAWAWPADEAPHPRPAATTTPPPPAPRVDAPAAPAPTAAPATEASSSTSSRVDPAAVEEQGLAEETPSETPARRRARRRRTRPTVTETAAVGPAPAEELAEEGPSPEELTRQALAAYTRAQLPRARALYRRAVERDPSHAPAWRGLGLVAARMGNHAEARRALGRYLDLAPSAPDAAQIRATLDGLTAR